jgi:DnaJ homologue, subfamily C, member 28, conserved domain
MPQHKPPGKSYRDWVEEMIQEAQRDGEFERLEGAGQPIPGITDPHDPDWWVKKLLKREKLTILPPALELLKKVEAGLEAAWVARDEEDVRARVAGINAEIARVNSRVADGPATQLAPLDLESIVREWRARRAPSS